MHEEKSYNSIRELLCSHDTPIIPFNRKLKKRFCIILSVNVWVRVPDTYLKKSPNAKPVKLRKKQLLNVCWQLYTPIGAAAIQFICAAENSCSCLDLTIKFEVTFVSLLQLTQGRLVPKTALDSKGQLRENVPVICKHSWKKIFRHYFTSLRTFTANNQNIGCLQVLPRVKCSYNSSKIIVRRRLECTFTPIRSKLLIRLIYSLRSYM